MSSNRSRTSDGLLCTAELKKVSVARRTFRSGSCRLSMNSAAEQQDEEGHRSRHKATAMLYLVTWAL